MLSDLEIIELEALLNFESARIRQNNFYEFAKYIAPDFVNDKKPYLQKICDALQLVSEGKIKKLAISLPPRSGKSYITSLWCAWMIGKNQYDPTLSIMRNAYGDSLAQKFSYDVRQIIQSDKFLKTFPLVELKPDKKSINDWAITTANQSTYFCAGVGGAITGKGCKTAAILDDGIKNIEEALSENYLDKVWQWLVSTHYTRMEKDCPNIHIGTRWSKKDPIGRAIAEDKGEGWVEIIVPALTEEGKSFCEEVKSTEEYLALKAITPDFIWQAVYMQNPIEAKGLLFPRHELNTFTLSELEPYIKGTKKFDAVFGYTDTADEGTDYLASGVVGAIGDKYYLLDVVYNIDPVETTIPLVAGMIERTKQTYHIVEANAGGKIFALQLRNILNQNKINCFVKWKPNTIKKETRILMQSGIVKTKFYFRTDYLPGSEYEKFMNDLTSYVRLGKNKNDDAPDCITGLAEMISKGNSINILGKS